MEECSTCMQWIKLTEKSNEGFCAKNISKKHEVYEQILPLTKCTFKCDFYRSK